MLIRVVHVRPSFPAEVVEVDTTDPKWVNKLLDDAWLAFVRLRDNVHAYVDDEGILKSLPVCMRLRGEVIAGPVVISKGLGDEDVGFTVDEALTLCAIVNRDRALD